MKSNKETIFLLLLAELVIMVTIFLIVFTFTGGWYQIILFDAIECEDWYKHERNTTLRSHSNKKDEQEYSGI